MEAEGVRWCVVGRRKARPAQVAQRRSKGRNALFGSVFFFLGGGAGGGVKKNQTIVELAKLNLWTVSRM